MPLALNDLPSGTKVFLDANILVYGLTQRSHECLQLLRRCAIEDLRGVTSLHVLNEVTHRLMLAEAVRVGAIAHERAHLLRKKHTSIAQLADYWFQTESVLAMNLLFLRQDEDCLRQAQSVRLAHGLLTNDSLVVAAMRGVGVAALASNDADFDRVNGLRRYAPSDVT